MGWDDVNIGTDYLGRLSFDGYERDILSKWNTRLRLENEYNSYVEKIIIDNLDYDMLIPSTFGDKEKVRYIKIYYYVRRERRRWKNRTWRICRVL